MDLSEKEIIKKIKGGDIDHFSILVERFSRIIYFYVKKKLQNEPDIADIVQNSFIKAYKGISRFDTQKTFYPYLFTIVKNEIADYYRKRKQEVQLDEEKANYQQTFDDDVANFSGLLNDLRAEYKTVITLYYLDGYSYKEIAEKNGKPINTIKTLLRRAKEDLRKVYEKK